MNTLRILLALAAYHDWNLDNMDFVTAFLKGDLEEEIFMEQPDGFIIPGQEHKVVRLRKALYGLKQAPREWNKKLHKFLISQVFIQSKNDYAFYYRNTAKKHTYLAVYVDDLIITGDDTAGITDIKQKLSESFKIKDLGELNRIIGIEVSRDRKRKTIHISQQAYVNKLLKRFNMADCKTIDTPEDPTNRLYSQGFEHNPNSSGVTDEPYAEAVGGLIYLMICTRIDIAHAVGTASCFISSPKRDHWTAVKRILRYLKGTPDGGITFGTNPNSTLTGYSDSDFANDRDKRKSVTGYVYLLNGGAICWSSKRQSTVARSTTEAEYMALGAAAAEAMWIKQFLSEMGITPETTNLHGKPIEVFGDNQGSIRLAENPVYHARTKHIDIQHHYVRELIENNLIKVLYKATQDMLADFLTKGVNRNLHKKCLDGCGFMTSRGSVGVQMP